MKSASPSVIDELFIYYLKVTLQCINLFIFFFDRRKKYKRKNFGVVRFRLMIIDVFPTIIGIKTAITSNNKPLLVHFRVVT